MANSRKISPARTHGIAPSEFEESIWDEIKYKETVLNAAALSLNMLYKNEKTADRATLEARARKYSNLAHELNNPPICEDIFIHRAMCVGFDFEDGPEKLLLEAKAARAKGYQYRLYLDIKDDHAFEQWKEKNKELLAFLNVTHYDVGSPVITLANYMKEPAFINAEQAFIRRLRVNSNYLSAQVNKEKDRLTEKYHFTEAQIREHIKNGMISILSWCNLIEDESTCKRVNVLLYSHGHEWISGFIGKAAKDMGYNPISFKHIKPGFLYNFLGNKVSSAKLNDIIEKAVTLVTNSYDYYQPLYASLERAKKSGNYEEIIRLCENRINNEIDKNKVKDELTILAELALEDHYHIPEPAPLQNNYRTLPIRLKNVIRMLYLMQDCKSGEHDDFDKVKKQLVSTLINFPSARHQTAWRPDAVQYLAAYSNYFLFANLGITSMLNEERDSRFRNNM